jgi:uncharacterized protein (TIGR02147 family)
VETVKTNKSQLLKPKIRTYSSAAKYLTDYYNYRKELDAQFSYEIWSHELTFKSRSTLRLICHGLRNVSVAFIDLFKASENLNAKEIEHFLLLAKLQNTQNLTLKKIYLDNIFENLDMSDKKVEIKNSLKFLSNPLLSKIQLLISFSDFVATEENLKNILKISLSKTQKALIELESLKLVESYIPENSHVKLYRSHAHYFSITAATDQQAIDLYHQKSLDEVKTVLQQDVLKKKMKSLLFSLSEDDYEELADTLDSFANKLKVKYGNNFLKHKKLYKINFQAYPVTDEYE